MKFTTLIAAAAVAVASTAATAENVATASGDVVMIEKNQSAGLLALGGLTSGTAVALGVFLVTVGVAVAGSGSGSDGAGSDS